MATVCEYCGSVTNGLSLTQTKHKVSTYGQKNHKSSNTRVILCSVICIKAMNKATVRRDIVKFIGIFNTGMFMAKQLLKKKKSRLIRICLTPFNFWKQT